jgi:hypothetical protein
VAALAVLPENAFVDFLDLLQKGASAENQKALAAQFESLAPSLRNSSLPEIIFAVASLQSVQANAHVPPETFASDIWDSLITDAPQLITGIEGETLKSRVSLVVEAKAIHLISSKIADLRTEVERSFCKARIFTDVRTAFGEDPEQPPSAMTILHNLQITYHDEAGRHKEFYVTLDDDELSDLKEVIERAEKKKRTLEELLAKANCRLFE